MPPKSKDWSHYLPSALFVIYTTHQASTKFTPAELLHGHQLCHPFEESHLNQDPLSPAEYAQTEFDRVRSFHSQAQKFIKRAQDRQ